ncbi:helix-turn-helix domain-containing protein [Goodfellowiella coeruleoviolacea]|uniref:Helix-turn-helix domain-containing protein n=1 Tax=Goodfellowiella coeruleoviolacea TaxID=334858 RepID=A0AAE3KFW7_9PSEU|nr:helix-turn-helix transcriptional regulator [Goodfellowiella coeruleoviolacea]MCP2164854.1 Helix-turn-helix domain-containing protein [Goodfellowiella coeruleoviolacea]
MARRPGPTIRRWQLGGELRRHREAAGVSARRAAAELETTPSTLSKIEGGKQSIKSLYVKLLAPLYGLSLEERERLLALAEEANQPGWWTTYGKAVPDWVKLYFGYESDASQLRTYESELVPGLLQTADYVRAIAKANRPDSTESDLETSVNLRRARQQRMTSDDAPDLHVVVNEAVLHREVGGPAVMRDQLRHLIKTSESEHVTIQVLPFRAGAHPAMTAPFTLLGFDYPGMTTVYLENGRGALYLDSRPDLARYEWMFDQLCQAALSAKDSTALMDTLSRKL